MFCLLLAKFILLKRLRVRKKYTQSWQKSYIMLYFLKSVSLNNKNKRIINAKDINIEIKILPHAQKLEQNSAKKEK